MKDNKWMDELLTVPLLKDGVVKIWCCRGVCETWHHLGRDPKLCAAALDFLTQVLERTQLFSEQPTTTELTVKIATIPPLAVSTTSWQQNIF